MGREVVWAQGWDATEESGIHELCRLRYLCPTRVLTKHLPPDVADCLFALEVVVKRGIEELNGLSPVTNVRAIEHLDYVAGSVSILHRQCLVPSVGEPANVYEDGGTFFNIHGLLAPKGVLDKDLSCTK
jgi:hypothetical protein